MHVIKVKWAKLWCQTVMLDLQRIIMKLCELFRRWWGGFIM